MKKIVLILLTVFCFFACSKSDSVLAVSEGKMANIVYDLMKEKKELNYKGVPGDSVLIYYNSVVRPSTFKKYKVSAADFDATYDVLSEEPIRFESFWKKVKVIADSSFQQYEIEE